MVLKAGSMGRATVRVSPGGRRRNGHTSLRNHSEETDDPYGQAGSDRFQLLCLQNLGTLAGSLSHQFNNLLNSIVGYTSLTLGEPDLPPDLAGNLEAIEQSARQAATLNYEFLSFASQETQEEPPELVDTGQLIWEVVHFLGRFPSPGSKLSRHIASDLPSILANPKRLKQVILALLLGARDLRSGSHLICLAAEALPKNGNPAEKVRIRISRSPSAANPLLGKTLNGRGGTETLSAHPTLPLIKSIVGSMGGSISVSPSPDGALLFEVVLPAAPRESGDLPTEPGPEALDGVCGAPVVLIADDEEVVRNLASLCLKRAGYGTLTAKNGAQALKIFQDKKSEIDLTLLDLTMPGMDGLETMLAIRQIEPQARFILTSGRLEEENAFSGLCSAFLRKPFTLIALKEVVTRVLREERAGTPH